MAEIITDLEKLGYRSYENELDVRKGNKEVRDIVIELKNTMREKGLTSLSAPQIGHMKRIFVIDFSGDMRSFINPIISRANGLTLSREKCSSIPNKEYIRIRNTDIDVTYMTPMGKIESKRFFGLAAIKVQHAIDHLDGLLLPDVGLEVDEDYDNATDEEKTQIIDMFLESLDIKRKNIQKDIEEDKDLKQLSDAINFMTKLQKGEVQLGDTVTVHKEDNGTEETSTDKKME